MSDWNKEIKARNDQKRIDEMKNERGIRFPGPTENLDSVPDFDNAGDGMTWFSKLTAKQVKQVKDIPFRVAGRRQLSLMERDKLSPLSHDSLTKLGTSNALQEVIGIVKNEGKGAELLAGAKRGGVITPMIGCQNRKRGGF